MAKNSFRSAGKVIVLQSDGLWLLALSLMSLEHAV